MENRPRGRDRNMDGEGKGIFRRGDGLGTGPVGSQGSPSGGSGGPRRGMGGGKGPISIIALLILLLFGGKQSGILNTLLQGVIQNGSTAQSTTQHNSSSQHNSSQGSGHGGNWNSLFDGGSYSTGWVKPEAATPKLDTTVAKNAREKRTKLLGNAKDIVTIMVYMCGTDLESRGGMATSDLQEMAAASYGNNVNVIVYTGGATKWKNTIVASDRNQIYQIVNGQMKKLVDNAGNAAMTDPKTLTEFIQYCKKNFPANRNDLILWDHGGGSISGYGYDETHKKSGSMTLAGIHTALENAKISFDFIGFDACLMATTENALMLNPYADYLIASEETEPGVGWYYTNWLSELEKNTSMPTIEIGKKIVDDFVDVCARQCPGQKTTLSVIDLAEFSQTVPSQLGTFSQEISKNISNQNYKLVSDARNQSREFSPNSKIDQVDLAHLALNLGGKEGEALAQSLQSAVKYNRTSSNMTNAYGVSIFFPYQRTGYVDRVTSTYKAIGMDANYTKAIKEFASVEASGQNVFQSSPSSSPLPSLLETIGQLAGNGSTTSSTQGDMGMEVISQLLSAYLGGDKTNKEFLSDSALSDKDLADYLQRNHFDASKLVWSDGEDGRKKMSLSNEQWAQVHDLVLNMFYDDGSGFIDMGLDNVFDFDAQGALLADNTRSWIAINKQPVAYYYLSTVEEGERYTIMGRVPILLNGQRANLLLVFDQDHPKGHVVGAMTDYINGETETVPKSMTSLNVGDTIDFVCDYYSYGGEYKDSYKLGEQMKVPEGGMEALTISNVDIGKGKAKLAYRFTDTYNQSYWTPAIVE